jgi:hypothetical protein
MKLKPAPVCGEECLNRVTHVECRKKDHDGAVCTNKRFQGKQYAKTKVFKTPDGRCFGVYGAA